jgi:CBS domain containing-hemolysin-like protein
MDDPASLSHLTDLSVLAGPLAVIAVCLLVLIFSSLCEAALMRTEPGRARQLAEQARRSRLSRWGARTLVRLLERRQEILCSLIVLINVSIIVVSAYTTEITIGLSGGNKRWVAATSLGMIAFILTFCEVAPKTYAVRRAEVVAMAMAPVLDVVCTLAYPVSKVLHLTALWLVRRVVVPLAGGEVLAGWPRYTDAEVMQLVTAGEEEGDVEAEERRMIAGVIEFADKVVREVMTPRTDIVCIPADASLSEAVRLSHQSGYSRLPVYEDSMDHVIGIVYAKDLVFALTAGRPPAGEDEDPSRAGAAPGPSALTAGQLARKPAPVVPESKRVDEVLRLMQRKRLHMAIVIDEYGGTAGVVTIEDLLEEIFGELRDEHDQEAESIRTIEESTLLVDARVSVDEIKERLGVALPEGEFDSVGGFILEQLGRVPAVGEKVTWQELEFIVEAVSENRIETVRIIRKPEGGQHAEDSPEGG